MSRSRAFATRALLGGIAAMGVIGAHLAAYLMVAPHPHDRRDLLEATGHRYWSVIAAVATALFVATLLRFMTARLWSPLNQAESGGGLYRYAATRLIPLQLGCFLSLEALERLLMGVGVGNLLSEPAVLVGMAVQVLFALVLAGALVLISKGVEWLEKWVHGLTPEGPDTPVSILTSRLFVPALQVASGSGSLRGPPSA